MTRINVGIDPKHLCDQHLIAEYRELPRLFGKTSKNPAPSQFTLGKGHVLWCQQYQLSLEHRQARIIAECKFRNIRIAFAKIPSCARNQDTWNHFDELDARKLLIPRICDRLRTMKREPKWTVRDMPDWARYAMSLREADKMARADTEELPSVK